MPTYFAVRLARGPDWDAALPLREQPLWDQHAAFMDALTAEEFVILGGPLGGEAGALVVVDAKTEEAIRARFAHDPWLKSGQLRIASIDSWEILLDSRQEGRYE